MLRPHFTIHIFYDSIFFLFFTIVLKRANQQKLTRFELKFLYAFRERNRKNGDEFRDQDELVELWKNSPNVVVPHVDKEMMRSIIVKKEGIVDEVGEFSNKKRKEFAKFLHVEHMRDVCEEDINKVGDPDMRMLPALLIKPTGRKNPAHLRRPLASSEAEYVLGLFSGDGLIGLEKRYMGEPFVNMENDLDKSTYWKKRFEAQGKDKSTMNAGGAKPAVQGKVKGKKAKNARKEGLKRKRMLRILRLGMRRTRMILQQVV
ncbi:hypothetical protein EJ08DRAFT_279265 [Tothia fuscella]|uniref:Uncharacterized protein n=1 Tax=Tothia fuscella TaxID=1048955 RepID=A0A9P4TY21_9PEZI|nr:hypothetical protein EJ08DRAFT_279265 [Tothia fuscella]